jgi:hypothetical protein
LPIGGYHYKSMNQVRWVGTFIFALLGIASIVFYRERVLYLDSAYYAFSMINKELPTAEHNRFALYLYQLVPWLMLKLKCSIPTVLIAFSISHTLLHALVFYILLKIRQPKMAALLAIMQVIAYRECFFLTVNETALAMSATLLLAGLLNYFRQRQVHPGYEMSLYFICIVVAVFSHPMAIILISFILVYHILLNRRQALRKNSLGLLASQFVLIIIIKKAAGQSSGYEDNLFAQLNNTRSIMANLGEVNSFNFFFGHLKTNSYFFRIYILPLALGVICLFKLLKNRQYALTLFYMFSSIGFWFLIIIFFNRGDGTIFMEKNFTPWILVTLYPLTHLLNLHDPRLQPSASFVYLGIVIYSFWGISRVTPMYKNRLYLMDQLITVNNPAQAPKLLVQDSLVNHETWLGIWALPYETLLLAKVKHIPNVTARIYRNEETVNKELHRTDIFLGADFIPVLPASYLLNQKYFALPEERYVEVRP